MLFSGAIGMFLPDPLTLAGGLLSLLVGRRMWRAANADGPAWTLDIVEEGSRLCRVLGTVFLATAVAGIIGLSALAAIAAVTMAVKGRAGIAAAIGVLLIMAVLHTRKDRADGMDGAQPMDAADEAPPTSRKAQEPRS